MLSLNGGIMYKPGGTIAEALKRIHSNGYVLPAIQREFVWKPKQIERLFDSLMQGYPFGTFLFWKVEAATSAKFKFYKFVLNYHTLLIGNYPGGWAARLARGGAFGPCPALARHALG